jgi:hypothetical protein
VALLKDLDNSVLLLGGAELSLKGALGGRVVGALVAVPVVMSALLLLLYVYHCIGVRYTSMVGWAYLWVTKILKLSTTWARGTLLSFFHSSTALVLSTKTMKSSLSPL